jgi:hypothetical protein
MVRVPSAIGTLGGLGGWAYLLGKGNSYHPAVGHRQKRISASNVLLKNYQIVRIDYLLPLPHNQRR